MISTTLQTPPARRATTLMPRNPRVLHAGPRVRILEVMFLLHLVVGFLCGTLAWLAWKQQEFVLMGAALAAILLVAALDFSRLRALKGLKELALTGNITQAYVTTTKRCRIPRALRADGPLPRGGLPFVPGLEVHYSFTDRDGHPQSGRFLTRLSDRKNYRKGHPIEIFFSDTHPAINASSIVLRWYFRLGGPCATDDAPPQGELMPFVEDIVVFDMA